MKGLELPINVLVLVSLAVIVLIGMIAMYTMGIGPFSSIVGGQAIKNAGCAQLMQNNCGASPASILTPTFDSDRSTEIDDQDDFLDYGQNYLGCNKMYDVDGLVTTDSDDMDVDETLLGNVNCIKVQCGCPGNY